MSHFWDIFSATPANQGFALSAVAMIFTVFVAKIIRHLLDAEIAKALFFKLSLQLFSLA
jgi:hypothetical protein